MVIIVSLRWHLGDRHADYVVYILIGQPCILLQIFGWEMSNRPAYPGSQWAVPPIKFKNDIFRFQSFLAIFIHAENKHHIRRVQHELPYIHTNLYCKYCSILCGFLDIDIHCRPEHITYIHIHTYIHTKKIKSVAYGSQGSHTGQLDFCNWLADGSTTG